MKTSSSIVIVSRPTRLEGLRARWGTARQAEFVLQQSHAIEAELGSRPRAGSRRKKPAQKPGVADFEEYNREDTIYHRTIERLHLDQAREGGNRNGRDARPVAHAERGAHGERAVPEPEQARAKRLPPRESWFALVRSRGPIPAYWNPRRLSPPRKNRSMISSRPPGSSMPAW